MFMSLKNRRSRPATAGAVFTLLVLCSAPLRADVVTDWVDIATQAIVGTPNPVPAGDERPAGALHTALMAVAMYDAVNAIDGSYEPFAVTTKQTSKGASKEAAAAAAAYHVLKAVFPSRTVSLFDPAYTTSLGAIPNGQGKQRGIAIGKEVAEKWLAQRAKDGRNADVPYAFVPGVGQYELTPGAPPTAPIMPWMAKVKPLVMKRPSQFRPEGPPALDSWQYAADVEEVQVFGRLAPGDTTSYKAVIAKFHTRNPNLFWGESLNAFVVKQGLSIAENARLTAILWVSMADATIACWDGKMHFNFWRPVTAIRKADLDGNPDTIQEIDWTPRETTPPHQEYPAAHGCVAASVAEAMRRYFGTRRVTFTAIGSGFAPGSTTTRTYTHVQDLVDEVQDARVYGGMHFRTATEDGADMGEDVARLVAKNAFRPRKHHGHRH